MRLKRDAFDFHVMYSKKTMFLQRAFCGQCDKKNAFYLTLTISKKCLLHTSINSYKIYSILINLGHTTALNYNTYTNTLEQCSIPEVGI